MTSWTPNKLPDRFPQSYHEALQVAWYGKPGEVHRTLVGWVGEEKGLKTLRNKFSSFKAALHGNPTHRLHKAGEGVKHRLELRERLEGFDVIAVTERKWMLDIMPALEAALNK